MLECLEHKQIGGVIDDKENIAAYGKKICKIGGYLLLALVPVFSYLLFELVTGNLETIPWYMAALNIGWIYVLYLIVLGISGTSRIAVPLVSILLLIASWRRPLWWPFASGP